jgi:PIN domain nuclease of toxin-antitoxin system
VERWGRVTYLVDTHAILWAAYRVDLLSPHALEVLESKNHVMLVSAASAWEIATKYRLGKLPHARSLAENFVPELTAAGYTFLPISVEHALRAGRFTGAHNDPFDRMLAAQAIHEDVPLLSNDVQLDSLGVRREW